MVLNVELFLKISIDQRVTCTPIYIDVKFIYANKGHDIKWWMFRYYPKLMMYQTNQIKCS